jgi:hypothetical protein
MKQGLIENQDAFFAALAELERDGFSRRTRSSAAARSVASSRSAMTRLTAS